MSMPQRDGQVTVTIEPTGDDAQRFAAYRHLAAHHARVADRMQQTRESANPAVVSAIHARAALVSALAAVAELYRPGA